jgi:hypothetical protein
MNKTNSGAARHTEDPWIIDNRPQADVENKRLGQVVAEVPTCFGSITIRAPKTIPSACPSKGELDRQGQANANLIIAAPDLLRALKNLEEGVRSWICRGVTDEDMRQAQAAIGKAEAES